MAYTSWSVVFGEQPSAAKWNILGANDASFNDGSGIANGVITSPHLAQAFFRGRYQSDTSNSSPTGLTVQFGWGFIVGSGGASTISETVTFPTAFSAAPWVIHSFIGTVASTTPSAISDFNAAKAGITFSEDITTSSFLIEILDRDSGGTTSASNAYGYSWMAIGTV